MPVMALFDEWEHRGNISQIAHRVTGWCIALYNTLGGWEGMQPLLKGRLQDAFA